MGPDKHSARYMVQKNRLGCVPLLLLLPSSLLLFENQCSLVARLLWEQEVVGSNPAFSTMWMITQTAEGSSLENCQRANNLAKVRILHHPPKAMLYLPRGLKLRQRQSSYQLEAPLMLFSQMKSVGCVLTLSRRWLRYSAIITSQGLKLDQQVAFIYLTSQTSGEVIRLSTLYRGFDSRRGHHILGHLCKPRLNVKTNSYQRILFARKYEEKSVPAILAVATLV